MGDIADYLLERALMDQCDYGFHKGYKEVEPDESIRYKCGICGSKGVIRTNRNTGVKFVGCSAFPECKNTSNFEEEEITDKENNLTKQDVYEYFLQEYSDKDFRVKYGHWPDFKTKKEVDDWINKMDEIVNKYFKDDKEE